MGVSEFVDLWTAMGLPQAQPIPTQMVRKVRPFEREDNSEEMEKRIKKGRSQDRRSNLEDRYLGTYNSGTWFVRIPHKGKRIVRSPFRAGTRPQQFAMPWKWSWGFAKTWSTIQYPQKLPTR